MYQDKQETPEQDNLDFIKVGVWKIKSAPKTCC